MPNQNPEQIARFCNLRNCQFTAIVKLEQSFADASLKHLFKFFMASPTSAGS